MDNIETNNKPIGVFDSGVGGLSVLRSAMEIMPNEDYIYIGDFANAPYGSKSKSEINKIVLSIAQRLISMDVKAILVACNTATSTSAHILRTLYDIPIVGLEPALKPAVQNSTSNKSIVVMATPQTLRLEKFKYLLSKVKGNVRAIPCPGLSRLIESCSPNSYAIKSYISEALSDIDSDNTSSIVLGCTHFSFISDDIINAKKNINIYDGRFGAARQLKNLLKDNLSDTNQNIKFISTIDDDYHNGLLEKFMKLKI